MRRTKKEWADIVRNYRSSSLTVHQFCVAEHVVERSLRNCIRRLGGAAKRGVQHNAAGFVEIRSGKTSPEFLAGHDTPSVGTTENRGLVIQFPVGISVAVYPGTDRATLALVFDLIGNYHDC